MAVYGPVGSEELYHYGVLGMKWGVRKDRDSAYRKANKKAAKNYKKYQKAARNAIAFTKAKQARQSNDILSDKDYDRLINRASKVALKRAIKGGKWLSEMDKTFSKVGLKLDTQRGKEATDYFNTLSAGHEWFSKMKKEATKTAWKSLAVSLQYDDPDVFRLLYGPDDEKKRK